MSNVLKKKLEIAKRASLVLQFIPYIRMVSICNSVARGKPKKSSDIDLFIIAKDKHIFTVRYAAVFLMTIFGLKPIPKKGLTADKICLSLFLSNNHLNLDRLNKNKKEELARANWILDIVPIFSEGHTYINFIDKNSWIKKYYRNYYTLMAKKNQDIKNSLWLFLWRKLVELIFIIGIGWLIEKIVRYIQINRLLRLKHSHFGKERMIINDQIIKLHFLRPEDKKPLF